MSDEKKDVQTFSEFLEEESKNTINPFKKWFLRRMNNKHIEIRCGKEQKKKKF